MLAPGQIHERQWAMTDELGSAGVDLDPTEGAGVAINAEALPAGVLQLESAAQDADDQLGRPGKNGVGIVRATRPGADSAIHGLDDHRLIARAQLSFGPRCRRIQPL